MTLKARRDVAQASKILGAAGRALADVIVKTQSAKDMLNRGSVNPQQKVWMKELDVYLKSAGKTLRKLMESL